VLPTAQILGPKQENSPNENALGLRKLWAEFWAE